MLPGFFLFSRSLLGALFYNFIITQGLNIIFEILDSLVINLLDYLLGNNH